MTATPLCIAKFDVEKAFDKIRHVAILRDLRRKNVPPALIAAIMMEYADGRIEITLDSMPMATVTMKRGVRQGSPLSPALFAIVVDMALDDIYDFWHKNGRGYHYAFGSLDNIDLTNTCQPQILSEMTFADDMTLLARNDEELQSMIADICGVLAVVGLKLSIEKCQWMSTEPDAVWTNMEILGKTLELVPELLFFGTKLSFDHTNDVELNHRISKGWKYFWAHKGLFCNKHAARKSRLHVWGFTCRKCIMWCTEIMAWTYSQLIRLDDMQV